MNKDFCNTEFTLIQASLEASWPLPCGCTSVFQFGTGQIRGASEALQGRRLRRLRQQEGQRCVLMQTALLGTNAFCTEPLLGPCCQQMHTRVVQSCWSGTRCSDAVTLKVPVICSPLPCIPLPLIFLLPACVPLRPLGRGIGSLPPSGNPAQAVTSQQHRLSQTPGHSSTWKRGK